MKSFLLIGQSNMAGRGDFSEVPEIINKKCFMMRNGRFIPMREPINPDRSMFDACPSGVGLSASFADRFANHFGEDVGLIPCAEGSTALSEWMPGELLFDNAVNNALLAKRTSKITGILWHQGENDCLDEHNAKTYKERFFHMITTLREKLGDNNIPVIIGELGEFVKSYHKFNMEWADTVNKALTEISLELNNCTIASAKGLVHKGDGIHFSSGSYRIFGVRYFEAYLRCIE